MNSENLSELASLYALNMLDDEDAGILAQFGDALEFQAEVTELESAIAMMAYSVDVLPVPPNLKDRLFQRIAAEEQSQENEITILLEQSKSAQWQPYSLAKGVEVATLKIDVDTRQVQCFVRSSMQIKFPEHRHAGNEEIIVLEGDLAIGNQRYKVGDRVYSQPGTTHQPETMNGCVLYLRTSLDDEILS